MSSPLSLRWRGCFFLPPDPRPNGVQETSDSENQAQDEGCDRPGEGDSVNQGKCGMDEHTAVCGGTKKSLTADWRTYLGTNCDVTLTMARQRCPLDDSPSNLRP
jgi:hypothetical protein